MLEMFFVFMPKLTILEVTEISQGCAVSLKGSDRSLYGNDRFPYKERGPTERERLLKVIFNALDVNYCYFNDNCVPKLFDRLALSPSSSGIRPVTSPPTKSPHRNTYRTLLWTRKTFRACSLFFKPSTWNVLHLDWNNLYRSRNDFVSKPTLTNPMAIQAFRRSLIGTTESSAPYNEI